MFFKVFMPVNLVQTVDFTSQMAVRTGVWCIAVPPDFCGFRFLQ